MRRFGSVSSVVVAAVVAFFIFSSGVLAGEEHKKNPKQVELKGEILDMACYISHGARGADHAACAKKCVKGGQPVGLITDDGKVFILFGGHDDMSAFNKVKDFAGSKVVVKGELFEQNGMKGVTVRAVKSL